MISLLNICEKLNELLNEDLTDFEYKIYGDAELHKIPKRQGNEVKEVVEGIATIISSSIVPIQGLKLGTQTIAVEFAVPINTREMTEEGIESIVERYKAKINAIVSEPKIFNDLDGFVVTMTGTIAEVGEVQQQSSIGVMIPIDFTITLNYFENGLNSLNQKLLYNDEEIPFTSLSIGRAVIQDGGATSYSNGVAKNYVQTTALAIEINLPAIKDNAFCNLFRSFLRYGVSTKFQIEYLDNGESTKYWVIFLTSNLQAQGVDNVGYTITLAEAL